MKAYQFRIMGRILLNPFYGKMAKKWQKNGKMAKKWQNGKKIAKFKFKKYLKLNKGINKKF